MDLSEILDKLNESEDVVLSEEELELIADNFDQLDELSKSTLLNYISKAGRDVVTTAKTAGRKRIATPSSVLNRLTGIDRAAAKLPKRGKYKKTKVEEDVDSLISNFDQLDELSVEKLGQYIKSAHKYINNVKTRGNDLDQHPKIKNLTNKLSDLRKAAPITRTAKVKNMGDRVKLANKIDDKKMEIDPTYSHDVRKQNRRWKGIDKASDKLRYGKFTKESVMEAAIDTLKPGGAPGELKSDLTAKLLAMTPMMSIEDLRSTIDGIVNQFPAIAAANPDNSDANRKSVAMKEDVQTMFSGQELSEEFKDKVATLLESALAIRVTEELTKYRKELEEAQDAELEVMVEEVEDYISELEEKIDAYTDYVAEQFMTENEVAIESALKNEINENFIEGLKNLFTEHYIEVPEERYDILATLESQISDMQEQMDLLITRNNDLEEEITSVEKDAIVNSVVENLSTVDQNKVKQITESLDYDDVDSFVKKVQYIKEKVTGKPAVKSNILEESFDNGRTDEEISEEMKRYVNAISRTTVK